MRERGMLAPLSRCTGRAGIERSIRGLLLRVHRFSRARVVTVSDRDWAARTIAGLESVLKDDRRN
jgi:hypothetical protein